MVHFQSNRRLSTILREEIEAKIWFTFFKRQFSQTKNRTIRFIFDKFFLVCCLFVENGSFRYIFGSILVRWIELSSSIEPSNLIELPGSTELELELVRFGRSLTKLHKITTQWLFFLNRKNVFDTSVTNYAYGVKSILQLILENSTHPNR